MSQLRFARILGFLFYYSSGKLLRVSPNYLNGRNPRDIRRRHAYMNMNMYKKTTTVSAYSSRRETSARRFTEYFSKSLKNNRNNTFV